MHHSRTGLEHAHLTLEPLDYLALQLIEFRLIDRAAFALNRRLGDHGHCARRLLAAHHRGFRIRPGKAKARINAAPTYAVISGAGQKIRPWPNMDEILADANSDQARCSVCTAGVRVMNIEPYYCSNAQRSFFATTRIKTAASSVFGSM